MIVVALLWLCICVLVRSDRQREICMVGTLALLVAYVALHLG